MENFTFETIAKKSVHGAIALTTRTFFIQLLGILASFILTIYLDQFSFGVFAIVSSLIIFFAYFQDIGLAASLIQKREHPTLVDYRTVFTIQQIVVLILVVPSIIFSGNIVSIYGLNVEGQYLFISLLISFFLSSLRTVPTVMLERDLRYSKLVIPEIVEGLLYNLALIIGAVSGFGVTSFTIAVLVRSIGGLVAIYLIMPWRVGFAFNKTSLKTLLSFGVPFQMNNILALFKDHFLTLYLGLILPLSQLGIVAFAQKLAFLPLRLVMDNIIKITFPSYSRLQDDEKALRIAIEKSLFVISFMIFPVAIMIIMLSPYLIEFIPRYSKWEPAVLSVLFFALSTVLSSISTPLTNFLNAIGKVKITLYFMIFWTIATWVVTIIAVERIGFNGVALAAFLVSLSSLAVFAVTKRYLNFSVIKPIYKSFIGSILLALIIYIIRPLILSFVGLVFWALVVGCLYLLIMLLISKKEIVSTLRFAMSSFAKEK